MLNVIILSTTLDMYSRDNSRLTFLIFFFSLYREHESQCKPIVISNQTTAIQQTNYTYKYNNTQE